MSALGRRLTALLLLAIAFALPAGGAEAAHRENVATATIEQDGGRAFEFAWDVSRQRGGVVDHHNAAHAAARCIRCSATAIAFQIVIVSGAPSTVGPINEAVALNHQCTECVVVAEARQFVRVVDGPVRLTGAGRAQLAEVRRTLAGLDTADMPLDKLHQAVERSEATVRTVLADELVRAGDPGGGDPVLHGETLQDVDAG
jgi:putative peptide zinc metalloprotease protein